jgi:hypothetical protein
VKNGMEMENLRRGALKIFWMTKKIFDDTFKFFFDDEK